MLIYILLALLAFSFIVIDDKFRKQNNKRVSGTLYLVLSILLCSIAALRTTNVGADTSMYTDYFEMIRDNDLSVSMSYMSFLEPGYIILNKVASFISENPQIITIINSLLLFSLLHLCLKKNSHDRLLSVFLFITLGFFQTSLNITRSCCAAFLGYLSIDSFKKNKLRSIATFIVAILIHRSVLILCLVPLLEGIKLKKSHLKYYIGAILLAFYALESIIPLLSQIIPDTYGWYLERGTEGIAEKALPLIVHLFIFVVPFLFIENKNRAISENNRAIIFLLLETLFYLFSIRYAMFTRVAYLFSMYIIFSVPSIISSIREEKKMRVKYLVVSICLLQYLIRLPINNIGKTIPYENVLSKGSL